MPRHSFFFLACAGAARKVQPRRQGGSACVGVASPNLCKYAALSEYVRRMASESGITESEPESESNNNSSNNNNNEDNNNNNMNHV